MFTYLLSKAEKFTKRLVFLGERSQEQAKTEPSKSPDAPKDAVKVNTDAAKLLEAIKAKIQTDTLNNPNDPSIKTLISLRQQILAEMQSSTQVSQELALALQDRLNPIPDEKRDDFKKAAEASMPPAQRQLSQDMYRPETAAEGRRAGFDTARAQDAANQRAADLAALAEMEANQPPIAPTTPSMVVPDGGSKKLAEALDATAGNAETPPNPISEAVKNSPGRFRPEEPQDQRTAARPQPRPRNTPN